MIRDEKNMSLMHNPPHPGKVLREYLGDMEVADAAARLKVSRTTLSRVLNGRAGISADMSLRLSDALGTILHSGPGCKWITTSGTQAGNAGLKSYHSTRPRDIAVSIHPTTNGSGE